MCKTAICVDPTNELQLLTVVTLANLLSILNSAGQHLLVVQQRYCCALTQRSTV